MALLYLKIVNFVEPLWLGYYCFSRYCDRIRHRHRTAIYFFVKNITSRLFCCFLTWQLHTTKM